MKKLVYLFIAIFMGAHSLYAQDCATGYCPSTITVHHKAGDLSAETKDITYDVVAIGSNCWLQRNLGATTTGYTTSYAWANMGWYYQWGSKQAYYSANSTSAPSTSYTNAASTWPAAQDPCTLTLGSAWHVPTSTETATLSASTVCYCSTAGTLQPAASYQIWGTNQYYATIYQSSGSSAASQPFSVWWQSSQSSSTLGNTWGVVSTNVYQSTSYAQWKYELFPLRCVKSAAN